MSENLNTQRANVSLVKRSYKNMLAMGEGVNSADFRMIFSGYPDIEFLVQASQLPEIKRELIDSKGPHGVMFKQQGNVLNAGDITITIKEVVTGKALEFLRDVVRNKVYLDIVIALVSETQPQGIPSTGCLLSDCWIEVDGTDFSVEDGTTLIKPNGTIHYNWSSMFDDPAELGAVGWE